MAKLRFQLTESQRSDLEKILRADPRQLQQATERVRGAGRILRPVELREAVLEPLGGEVAHALTRTALALLTFRRRYRANHADLLRALDEAVLSDDRLPSETRDRWKSVKPIFDGFLGAEAVGTAAKALHLSLDHANLFEDIRIVCDIRPVFDDRQTQIVGAIVTHLLRLEYVSDDGPHTLSMVMSDDDLTRLAESCRSAKIKSEKVKEGLNAGLRVQAFIAGEENYDAL